MKLKSLRQLERKLLRAMNTNWREVVNPAMRRHLKLSKRLEAVRQDIRTAEGLKDEVGK